MARKSAAALAAVTPLKERPAAPTELTDDERVVWDAVVATKPADWFTRDTHPLLVQYCRATLRARQVAKIIEDVESDGGMTGADKASAFKELVAMEARISGTLSTLATKMRISQQSRYGARGADGSHHRANAGAPAKPWEFGKAGS
jgi:hypothetical protein